jgi:hypothetical protein
MKQLSAFMASMAIAVTTFAQVINTATMDSSDYKVKGRVTVEGYVDSYYAYNFNKPQGGDIPYFVSMARHNEVNINLAFVGVKYSSQRVRVRVVPGFGTYLNANYANESGTLKNLIEANAGIRVFKNKGIWLDVGVLGSPYTNESALSKDHLAYTRSLAAENVPYYLSGVKATLPVSKKIAVYLFLINGWQQITDQNSQKSFGSQLEFRPNNNMLINWNTYVGKEKSAIDSINGTRYFSDLYFIYNKNKLSVTSCIYYGIQEHLGEHFSWTQANVISRYYFHQKLSGTLRLEYFKDLNGVLIVPITSLNKFETYGVSIGMDVRIDDNVLFRTEARQFFSTGSSYIEHGNPTTKSLTLTGSLCAWF